MPTAIVVGAGAGGVSAACRLAHAGFDVTVVERQAQVGGRCSLFTTDRGYRFDVGPSLLLLPRLFEQAFEDVGTTMQAEGIELVRCDPNYNVYFGDSEKIKLSSDLTVMKKEVERFEGEQGFAKYLEFMREAHVHYELSYVHVLHKNFTSLLSMLRPALLKDLLTLHPFESIGMSPFDALATYSLLQYTEFAEGIWYPLGGFQTVLERLAKVAERKGAKFRMSTSVKRVLLSDDGKTAKGVVLEDGEELTADVVVINADLIWSLNNLFKPTAYARRLADKPVSCSSISFYWSMDQIIPELGSHTIFLADEYRESFDSIFREHSIPQEPSFYVNKPTHVDPTAAPKGKDAVIVLVPVGHISDKLPSSSNWDAIVKSARQLVIERITKQLNLTDFESHIIDEEINTPITWRDNYNLHRGSILGLSHSFFNVLAFRPKTRHPSVKRAYFVGASTHPGTGVPICLAGGRITTEQILDDFKMSTPWHESSALASKTNQNVKKLDVKRQTWSPSDLLQVMSLVAALCVGVFAVSLRQ
ncbi:hypothetical protein OIO90_003676 [Microbotryomycetes sp. JL221]|nr:hypothetical protein OIO90_003676 [Microbotryomycetes sp. JL221]